MQPTQTSSLWLDLLGAQVRLVTGAHYTHRVIEAGGSGAVSGSNARDLEQVVAVSRSGAPSGAVSGPSARALEQVATVKPTPLILVHGVGSSAELFARNVMPLAQHFHVYAIDALYHGYSSLEPYDAENRVRTQADALLDFMDAEGIERAHLEGESMGAGMIFDLAMRHPERCGRLVITSGSYFVNMKREFEAGPEADLLVPLCRDSVVNFSRETVRRRMEYLVSSPDHLTNELVEVQYRMYSDPAIRESMKRVYGVTAPRPRLLSYEEEQAAQVKVPALVIWTDKNRGASPAVGEYLAQCIGAGYHLIRDAAHWPQWEQPDKHNRVVADFLLSAP